ncbi:glycosyltransferase family 4 protein [Staphylococcus lloydii]|uniref:glycosyltransferase family 4 protein n=1 Tax=Staphylococcus lloydii TaxID=2781774 RepID=UPI0029287E3E|nr:glycosyltransferase family 4 protein [Staphylococcus lloydii]MDU9418019.1 glycosyltransferase family 4 protein [Staphylococcus lloydii]
MRIMQIAAIEMTHKKLLRNLNETCARKGFDVHCVSKMEHHFDMVSKEGIVYHNINIDREIKVFNNIKTVFHLVKLMKQEKPNIVHVHTPVAAVLGRLAAKIAKVPTVIYTAHGFYFHDGMPKSRYYFYFLIEKLMARLFTDYLFTQSKEDYKVAIRHNFLSHKNAHHYRWISNGIDLKDKFNYDKVNQQDIKCLKQQHNIKKGDLIITFIGRLVEEKGIIDLLEAIEKVKHQNIKVFIIGDTHQSERDTTTVNTLEKYKKQKQHNIIFTGSIDNINDYLYLSDIFCLPSYREGMPRSIIEAMAMKNAIIATNIRGCREEVVDNVNGYIVPISAPQYIATKIDALANNPKLLAEFKDRSHEFAHKYYDEHQVVQQQIEVFEQLQKGE